MPLLSSLQTQTSKDMLPVNGQTTSLGPICKFKYTSKQYESLASQFNIYVTIVSHVLFSTRYCIITNDTILQSVFTVVALVALLAVLRDMIDLPKGSRNAN